MTLGEFIKNFSHNNLIRLLYKDGGGHRVIFNDFNDVSMDHRVNREEGIFGPFKDHKVLGLTTISFSPGDKVIYRDALNIVIEEKV